ncbi:endonuclease/exonuclease/phosphatase family protein [Xylariaceae sp. FL1651]|nr:endonuclease/exonuclease/phosphatase family protein [Xylariaceae sp. FL1651]
MNDIIQKAIKQTELARKPADSVSWEPDQPHAQPFFRFDGSTQAWQAVSSADNAAEGSKDIRRLALFSWNIDFMLPFAKSRMDAGLAELQTRVGALPAGTAAVVFLQECVAEDLDTVGEKAWVRDGFYRTDVNTSAWASGHYGTTTLVDRRLGVKGAFRVHYAKTRMERDALFVDVVFKQAGKEAKEEEKTIRFCNTHLESLALEPPYRPPQMAVVAKFMHEDEVHGALAAGDFNAIQPFDRSLHDDNNLKDAYLELGGKEDSEEGYTWGQQAATELRNLYGCSRMDKVYMCGGLKIEKFERFGGDVEVDDMGERAEIAKLGFEKGWITDHLGVFAEVSVLD